MPSALGIGRRFLLRWFEQYLPPRTSPVGLSRACAALTCGHLSYERAVECSNQSAPRASMRRLSWASSTYLRKVMRTATSQQSEETYMNFGSEFRGSCRTSKHLMSIRVLGNRWQVTGQPDTGNQALQADRPIRSIVLAFLSLLCRIDLEDAIDGGALRHRSGVRPASNAAVCIFVQVSLFGTACAFRSLDHSCDTGSCK